MVEPAYPGRVILRIKYNQTTFAAVGFFGGLMFGPVILLGFVGSPRDFLGVDFLPPFDHPRHLKSGLPPFPPPRGALSLYCEHLKSVNAHASKKSVWGFYRIYSINRPRRLLNFWTLRVGDYSRRALIRGWALIKFSPFSASVVC